MTYTLKSIGFISAVKISAIVSAAVALVPIVIFLLLNHFFKFWDVVIPPDLVGELLASAAFWAALTGGISTGIVVAIYNISARFFGGIRIELKAQHPPRKAKEEVEIN